MPTFKIDGKEITVDPGTTVLQAALANGIEIPHYCYHPALSIAGSCRMCLVEVVGAPKLVVSCATEARDDMEVYTQTDQVTSARRSMLEFFLINHPLDCPICDKAGECLLQDYTYKYGSSHSRMVEDKRVRPTKDLGGNILLYRNRCVMCTRCVRFFEEVVGEPYLFVENRGNHSDISIFPGAGLTHKMSGNVVEICPVGCLIDKDFLFHARVWNLKRTRSICAGCAAGCNLNLDHKDGKIYRIRSRENMQVNQQWICDDGRYIYHRYENLNRPLAPVHLQDGKKDSPAWPDAIAQIAIHLSGLKGKIDQLAIVGSSFATLEENYVLRKLFRETLGCQNLFVYQPPPQGENIVYKNGFTVYADKSPNAAGAKMLLGSETDFWSSLASGRIQHMIMLGGDIQLSFSAEQKQALVKLKSLIVLDVQHSDLTESANWFLPATYFAEQDGTFLNVKGRLQRFQAALTPPPQVRASWEILLDLYKQFNSGCTWVSASDIFNDLANHVPAFKDTSYFKLGDFGLKID